MNLPFIRYRRDLFKVIPLEEAEVAAGNAVEVGVAEGNFSRDMLAWPVKIPLLYMVDRWKTVPHQKGDASMPQDWHENNMREAILKTVEFKDRAVILRGNSVDMAKKVPDQSLCLVYIDGDHSYEGVTNDINAWLPKLIPTGIMAFHDYKNKNYGVNAAVKDFCNVRRILIHEIPEDKPEDAGAYFRWNAQLC
jgi:hypothetical protein